MARVDRYVFDKTRMEFRQVTRSVWTVFGKILKYFLVTASLAVVYYVVFSLIVNTDSERKLKRDIQMYESMYAEMLRKEELIGDVLEGLKEKDSEIYRQLFNSDSPDLGVIFPEGMLSVIADHSHTDFDKVWADSDRDYWMTAQEAKDYGMVDEVLTRKA